MRDAVQNEVIGWGYWSPPSGSPRKRPPLYVKLTHTGQLTYAPVRSGTVEITADAQTITDNGLGNLRGDIGAGLCMINYKTGHFQFTLRNPIHRDTIITCNYEWGSEEDK